MKKTLHLAATLTALCAILSIQAFAFDGKANLTNNPGTEASLTMPQTIHVDQAAIPNATMAAGAFQAKHQMTGFDTGDKAVTGTLQNHQAAGIDTSGMKNSLDGAGAAAAIDSGTAIDGAAAGNLNHQALNNGSPGNAAAATDHLNSGKLVSHGSSQQP